ncbi:hypothetical protein MKK75_12295 [Methylobacterium sp. J-030]|uniref:hypothetical protein n=1 Tax=Methylobacterium sp. J-030 TaxID=2836627 RepID=UPI001FBA3492|nr:hypothetical protein [Methylobacterium sp. J-030]MCJ2069560.1 hypothetical protein [Methylobacterium sp. J-030]
MKNVGSLKQCVLYACAGALLPILASCGGGATAIPGLQIGSDEGGSTYGFDALPFEVRRADGSVLTGHASVRLLRVQFYTQDAKKLVVCSGGFTLDREHASVPANVECTGSGILHGTVTTARSDRGEGTFTEPSGLTSNFRYGALLSQLRRSSG